ncbi:MAG: cellulase family glycosylhydrolase [Eubacteriales bacterium]|nr:cellulase family glycosylhydrolase [Eubacteriales bacterium]
MKNLDGYMAGVNLGGWLSQFSGNLARDPEHHFDRFITKKDIEQIASWGMDHVRVPFDYPLIEDDDNPFQYKEAGFIHLDRCLAWCKDAGLNLILDLHHAPGFSFGTPDKNTLFSDETMQQRFIGIWQAFARRYNNEGQNIVFELLNEIVEPDSTRWNQLASRTIKAIREIDTTHRIIVGGIDYNNVWRLSDMPIFDDSGIIYNFHMYEPFALTHQHAAWTITRDYPEDFVYPSDITPYNRFIEYVLEHGGREDYQRQKAICSQLPAMNADYITAFLQPAREFVEQHDLPLYCGEYGVIDEADSASRAAWTRDIAEFCLALGIGRAIWSYKGMNFTLIDDDGQPVSDDLIRAAALK